MKLPTPLRLIVDNEPVSGEILKDEGIALALANADPAWKAAWKEVAYNLPAGWEGIGEDIRFMCLRYGMPKPRSPNLWSSMVSGMISGGGLRHKFPWEWRIPTDAISHARPCRVLVRTAWL